MAKAPAASTKKAVSMNPTDFVAGGLPTDFDGEVIEARTEVWDYDGKTDDAGNQRFTLGVRLTIQPDDSEVNKGEPIIAHFSAGNPQHFAPSVDEENPVDGYADENGIGGMALCEGTSFVPTGSKSALNNNTNWAQFLEALMNAQFKGQLTPDVRFLEGLYGHWDRIPQKTRAGLQGQSQEGGNKKEILAITVIKPKPSSAAKAQAKAPAAKAAAPKPQAQAAAPAAPAAGGDLDDQLVELVKSALGGDPVKKGSLAGLVTKSALPAAMKAKGVPRVVSAAFLEGGMENGHWLWDAESGTVSAFPSDE